MKTVAEGMRVKLLEPIDYGVGDEHGNEESLMGGPNDPSPVLAFPDAEGDYVIFKWSDIRPDVILEAGE